MKTELWISSSGANIHLILIHPQYSDILNEWMDGCMNDTISIILLNKCKYIVNIKSWYDKFMDKFNSKIFIDLIISHRVLNIYQIINIIIIL